jgi:hypothetical protein
VLEANATTLPGPVAALRLIALTGLRREEVCGLRWAEIDLAGSCLRLENTKTGRSVRPIGSAAKEVLRSITKVYDTWVFPNNGNTAAQISRKSLPRCLTLPHFTMLAHMTCVGPSQPLPPMRAMGILPLANCWDMPAAVSLLATISGDPIQP